MKNNNLWIVVLGFILAIYACFLVTNTIKGEVLQASTLTAQDMQEIEAFQSDLVKYQEQSKVFRFALSKIKAKPDKVEAILKSLNLNDKL
jgi:hypothetical protein